MFKYPRTPHLEGSGLQAGDDDMPVISFQAIRGRVLVIEEKLDGANCAIGFDPDGTMKLQSRGHYLTGGPRESQFEYLKAWAQRWSDELRQLLGDRYLMFGEWLYATHTIFYTDLPHYFMEFDVFDRLKSRFLATELRQELLASAPFVRSVPVLRAGTIEGSDEMAALITRSPYIRETYRDLLTDRCLEYGQQPDRVARRLDLCGLQEGLYVKDEEDGIVKGRYKFVRRTFLQRVIDSESHWMERSILPNRLADGVELFR